MKKIVKRMILLTTMGVIVLFFFEIGLRIIFFQRKANNTFAVSAAFYRIKNEIEMYKVSKSTPTIGPYKIIAPDFTGDGNIDLAIGYYSDGFINSEANNTGAIFTIEQGDGKGNLS